MFTNTERAKEFTSNREQTSSNEEFFDYAELNTQKIDTWKLKEIVDGIVKFGEVLANMQLYKYEKVFAERIIWSIILSDGATITGLFARQGGKSSTVAITIIACAVMLPLLAEALKEAGIKFSNAHFHKFEKGFWCGVYAPDYDRARIIGSKIEDMISTPEAINILSAPEIGMSFPDKLSRYIGNLPRNSVINIKSANRRVSIEGDTWHLVVTDETQELDDYVLKKSISPMLASTNGTTVHIGSAYPKRVYFYEICKLNKKLDIDKTQSKKTHFEAPYQVVQKYNPYYKKYIEGEMLKLGKDSDEFRMSYELYFPLESGMFVTEDFLYRNMGIDKYVTNFDNANDHVIGIDVGKKVDSTVVTVLEVDWEHPILIDATAGTYRRYKAIKNWLEIHGDDYDVQFHLICEFLSNYKWNRLVIDATGVGEHMYDRLRNRFSPKGKTVIPFVYTRPDKSAGYQLLYREILSTADSEKSKPRLVFPNNERARALKKHKKFISQMTTLVKTYEGGYMLVYHESEDGHDDYGDSLMLAVYGAEEEIVEVAEEYEDVNIYKPSKHNSNFWRTKR